MAAGAGPLRRHGLGKAAGLVELAVRIAQRVCALAGPYARAVPGHVGSGPHPLVKPALLGIVAAAVLFVAGAALALMMLAAPPSVEEGVHLLLPPAAERPTVAEGDSALVVQPFVRAALAGLVAPPPVPPLPHAPDPALVDKTEFGLLPRIADNGQTPQQAYARPFDRRDDRFRLVLIIGGIGLSPVASQAAIDLLPAPVVLAIDADAPHPEDWARAARQAGHEVLATVPLKPSPPDDLGPAALRPAADATQTMRQLATDLGRFTGYVGVLTVGGAASGEVVELLRPVATALQDRGLLLADATVAGGGGHLMIRAAPDDLQRRAIDVVIDPDASAAAMMDQLDGLLSLASQRSVAVALGRPTPLILLQVRSFLARLDEARYVVAPVSAVTATGNGP